MGIVYKAEDTKLKRTVALKFLPVELVVEPEARERFVTEAQAASSLDHPNICTIHEIGGTEDGLMYIAMPYYEGKTLKEKIKSGDIELEEGLDIIRQIAQGLSKAQGKGIVHRDIKPANVIVTEDGLAKVLDFGLAKLAGMARITKTGTTMGTVSYMSPEQAQGEEVDSRTDIWSLGIVLYEILTGQLPFKGESDQSVIYSILNREPDRVSTLVGGLPEELEAMVVKALQKDAGERYQSFDEFLAGLKDVYKRLDIKPEWRVPLRSRWGKRRWIASPYLWAPAVILAAVMVGLILFYPTQAIPFQERDWILITDFENLTGDEVFDRTLDTAITVSLQQSRYANVFPRSRLNEVFGRMEREIPEKLDIETASEVAQREGIEAVIVPGITRIGNSYSISASILDPVTQVSHLTESIQTEGIENVLEAVDDLAEAIRRGLGESLSEIRNQRVSLIKATTSSLEALKKFSEAGFFWNSGKYPEARELWKEAVELDPEFAWAHSSLGRCYYFFNDQQKGEIHFEKALGFLDRLTERERLWITAQIEATRRNRAEAIKHFRIYLARYPDDRTGWYNMGNSLMFSGQHEEALEAYRKALEIDPLHASSLFNIATCYNIMGENQPAVDHYLKAFELRPDQMTHQYLNHEFGQVYVRMGEFEKAREVFEQMLSKEHWKKARGHRSLALMHTYRGQYDAAVEHLKEAILLNLDSTEVLSELRDRLFLAAAYRVKGLLPASREELERAVALRTKRYIDPTYLQIAQKLYARQNLKSESRALFAAMAENMEETTPFFQTIFHLCRGEIALADEKYDEALNHFNSAYKVREDNYVLESIAYAHYKKGDIDKAISNYERLVNRHSTGSESQEYWIESHYLLGRLYEERGDRAHAIQHFEDFLDLWKEADTDIPLLIDARKRLAGLKGL
jgi:serine/threonine protein kinase/tetratricopeptide (TPR) repeat protein